MTGLQQQPAASHCCGEGRRTREGEGKARSAKWKAAGRRQRGTRWQLRQGGQGTAGRRGRGHGPREACSARRESERQGKEHSDDLFSPSPAHSLALSPSRSRPPLCYIPPDTRAPLRQRQREEQRQRTEESREREQEKTGGGVARFTWGATRAALAPPAPLFPAHARLGGRHCRRTPLPQPSGQSPKRRRRESEGKKECFVWLRRTCWSVPTWPQSTRCAGAVLHCADAAHTTAHSTRTREIIAERKEERERWEGGREGRESGVRLCLEVQRVSPLHPLSLSPSSSVRQTMRQRGPLYGVVRGVADGRRACRAEGHGQGETGMMRDWSAGLKSAVALPCAVALARRKDAVVCVCVCVCVCVRVCVCRCVLCGRCAGRSWSVSGSTPLPLVSVSRSLLSLSLSLSAL